MVSHIGAIDSKLARLEKRRTAVKKQLQSLTAQITVLNGQRRRALQKKARQRGRVKEKKLGRSFRCPGRCLACVKRFNGEPGGPAHVRALCKATKSFLKRNGGHM